MLPGQLNTILSNLLPEKQTIQHAFLLHLQGDRDGHIKTPKVAPQKSLIINLYVLNTEKHGGKILGTPHSAHLIVGINFTRLMTA